MAGSLYGQYNSTTIIHGEGMGVGRLIDGDTTSDRGKKILNKVDCKMIEDEIVELHVQRELEKHKRKGERERTMNDENNEDNDKTRRFPRNSMVGSLNGIARVKKDDINALFDFGNPIGKGDGTSVEDALVFYQKKQGLPSSDALLARSVEYEDGYGIPMMYAETATENCDAMNVIITGNPGNLRQCTAIVGNFESYHVQRWMRVDAASTSIVKPELPLVPVSRGYSQLGHGLKTRGKSNFYAPPYEGYVTKHWDRLLPFFENVDTIMEELDPLLKRIARNNAVVVLTCNMGQSELLINFVCSARRRGFDLGHILVFPSDVETKEIADGLGLATYFDVNNLGNLPKGEAKRYMDKTFTAMMYAKVLCVLYPLLLGYDVLFQDVDIVWLNPDKDPLGFFQDESSKYSHFDILFQHDGSNTARYAPYSANSGFYFTRANKKTQYLFSSLLYHGDLIINWNSHQQVLVQLLAEHSSLFGLNVKIFERDTEMFPGGHHYHSDHKFMKKFVQGETDSYIFHMSWTENKANKILFLRQLGEWYVTDKCTGNAINDMIGAGSVLENSEALIQPCCAMEPLFSCHYRDKPSKLPCESSVNIDAGRRSFW